MGWALFWVISGPKDIEEAVQMHWLQSHRMTKLSLIIFFFFTLEGGAIFGKNTPGQWLRQLSEGLTSHCSLSAPTVNISHQPPSDTRMTFIYTQGKCSVKEGARPASHSPAAPWGPSVWSSRKEGGPQGLRRPSTQFLCICSILSCRLASAYTLFPTLNGISHSSVCLLIYLTQIVLTSI